MEVKFRIMHISDLHIFQSTDWNIMRRHYENLARFFNPDYLVVTGDYRHLGKKTTFSDALNFLNDLVNMFGVDKKNVFLVPGNHDVNDYTHRSIIIDSIRREVNINPDSYRSYMNHKTDDLREGFTEYTNFVCEFYGDKVNDERITNPAGVFCITTNNINFVMLNTALISRGREEEKEIVDIQTFSTLTINSDLPTIVMAHHPLECLEESHRIRMEQLINIHNVNVIMCGDAHKNSSSGVQKIDTPNTTIPQFVCGKGAVETGDTFSDLCVIGYECQEDGFAYVDVYQHNTSGFFKNSAFYLDPETPFSFRMFTPKSKGIMDHTNKERKTKQRKRREQKRTFESDSVKEPVSIWLPDAEDAYGPQTRFNSFTQTQDIANFIQPDSNLLGIVSVKGIGKTFLLQVKRIKSSKQFRCLPKCQKPSSANNWATERISFERYSTLKTDDIFNDLCLLWKMAIMCYVINTLKDEECKRAIDDYVQREKLSVQMLDLCTADYITNLNSIVRNIVAQPKWNEELLKNQNAVSNILCSLMKRCYDDDSSEKRIAIFIDKIDQAIKQSNAEPPAECVVCKKARYYDECKIPQKEPEFCNSENGCESKNCCYGCELFASAESNVGLRIYEKSNAARLVHVNIWQYLQLALVRATNEIYEDFEGNIRVYYTIRREALNVEQDRLGEHALKITRNVLKLTYNMQEQKRIFTDCIRHQHPSLLYAPEYLTSRDNEEYAFVGVNGLCHPYCKNRNGTNVTESLFMCIYRHSFDRSRDIQRFGEELTRNMSRIKECPDDQSRGELVKEIIENLAGDLAYCSKHTDNATNISYYREKLHYIPNYWSYNENFEHLLSLIDRNLLFEDDVKRICKVINGVDHCPSGGCTNGGCKRHPFSVLYSLGYLGYISQNPSNNTREVQVFLDSANIGYFNEEDSLLINNRVAYIVHPALTKSISRTFNKSMLRFKGFVLGKNLRVESEIVSEMLKDRQMMPESEFLEKYYFAP